MKEDVNLALSSDVHIKKSFRKAVIISFIFFAIMSIISAVLMMYNLFLNNQLNDLSKKTSDLRYSINLQSTKKTKVLQLQDRLSKIAEIIRTRKNLNKKINIILSLVPSDGMVIKKIEADEKSDLSLFDTVFASVNILSKDFTGVQSVDLISFIRQVDVTQDSSNPIFYEMILRFNYTNNNG